jgi:hypothetical protein
MPLWGEEQDVLALALSANSSDKSFTHKHSDIEPTLSYTKLIQMEFYYYPCTHLHAKNYASQLNRVNVKLSVFHHFASTAPTFG